ncbi:MAG: caspase family protein [Gammaproteobacteria bacterium]
MPLTPTRQSVLHLLVVAFGILAAITQAAPLGAIAAQPSSQGRRIALIVGNGHYAASPLTNPVHDAELIAKTLTSLGFEVQLATDSTQAQMKRAIQAFGATLDKAGSNSVGLFFYAGHGLQLNGRNYLIPVGANIDRDADVEIEAVSADWVLEQMRYARNRLNFVILDACRNNPFARSFRSADHGLAAMDAPAGVLIAYSTAPGEVAADGNGTNSPYSEALAHAMTAGGEPAELMFKKARAEVRRATSNRQTPWESSSLTGEDFYFAASRATVPATAANAGAPLVSPPSAGTQRGAADPLNRPDFMADELCRHAVGEWRIKSDAMNATVQLTADAGGIARIRGNSVPIPTQWECDADNRRFVLKYGAGIIHTVTMDGSEKLMFGYDQKEVPLIYTRQ